MSKLVLEGRLVFEDLYTPGGAPGYAPKYSVTLQVAKGTASEAALFAALEATAKKVWGEREGLDVKLPAVHADIIASRGFMNARVNVLDGDIYQPDYNAGFWVVKATRRTADQGQPHVATIVDTVAGPDGRPSVVETPTGKEPNAPAPGWGVRCLIDVWAQAKQERINLTIISCVGVVRGATTGGANPEQDRKAIEAFTTSAAVAPVLAIPGVVSHQGTGQPQNTAQTAPQRLPLPVAGGTPLPPQGPPAETLVSPQEPPAKGRLIQL